MLKRPFRPRPPLGAPLATPLQRVIAQWRGVDLTEQTKAFKNSARPVGNLVPGVLGQLGLERRRAEAEVVKVWNSLIDPVITAHAQPTGLHKGTLFVTVDNSAWLSEIVRYRRREILDRLQHSFGKEVVAKISYRVG